MAPFPETEIMTIKRIEVALRKMDLKLLKDGAYKLHEKFHSGFKFEYIDILKEIKQEVEHNEEITQDIKGILIPTIDDILQSDSHKPSVSSLTKLSYNTAETETNSETQSETKPEIKPARFDAFSAFGSTPASQTNKVEPFKEFQNSQETNETANAISKEELEEKFEKIASEIREEIKENLEKQNEAKNDAKIEINPELEAEIKNKFENKEQNAPKFEFKREVEIQKPSINENNRFQEQSQPKIQITQETKTKLKSVSIYFHLNNSIEKIKNIKSYRELINNNKAQLNELLSLLSEINTQSNVSVSELKTILEQLASKENKINLITNSSSSDFTHLLNCLGVNFSLFNSDKKLNVVPFLGLTNLFACTNCDEEYFDKENFSKTLIAQCPKCKSPMFPNLFALCDNSSEINISYYNCALTSLANSDVWLIIHPGVNNKTELDMLKTALELSKEEKEIFIVDKDINIRENCKKMFQQIKKDTKINIQISAIEDFFNTMRY